jgi:hypothetical protein
MIVATSLPGAASSSNGCRTFSEVMGFARAQPILRADIQGSGIASFDSTSGALSKIGFLPYAKSANATAPFGYTGQRIGDARRPHLHLHGLESLTSNCPNAPEMTKSL